MGRPQTVGTSIPGPPGLRLPGRPIAVVRALLDRRRAEAARVEALAQAQVDADEAALGAGAEAPAPGPASPDDRPGARPGGDAGPDGPRARRGAVGLRDAAAAFWRHPSPWIMSTTLLAALVARAVVGGWALGDLLVPLVVLATFPLVEWLIHVVVLHWRPLAVGPLTLDPLLSREHRAHHADPRDIPLVFIPWQTYWWLLPGLVAVALLAFPRLGLGLTWLVTVGAVGLVYEWVHYLIHSDYRPRSRAYRAIWRNHRLHHYKNERYWFTVTTSGTADRLLRTCPDPADVETSPTARDLLASSRRR